MWCCWLGRCCWTFESRGERACSGTAAGEGEGEGGAPGLLSVCGAE